MTETAPRLAADPAHLEDAYDVVIVGSGYGGAITAARLGFANRQAQGRLRIAVLERGDEHPTGTGPESEGASCARTSTRSASTTSGASTRST